MNMLGLGLKSNIIHPLPFIWRLVCAPPPHHFLSFISRIQLGAIFPLLLLLLYFVFSLGVPSDNMQHDALQQ